MDSVGDPVGWVVGGIFIGWPWSVGTGALSAVAHLGQWKQAESSSVDFYSFLRSSYYQTRRAQLREAQGLPPQIESPATPGPVVGSPATAGPAEDRRLTQSRRLNRSLRGRARLTFLASEQAAPFHPLPSRKTRQA